jgi:general secretion pathway protein H
LELELDGVVQEQETLVITTQNPQPQIILYASGETLPGALDMRASDNGELLWRIEWSLLGDFRALQGGEPTEEDFQ